MGLSDFFGEVKNGLGAIANEVLQAARFGSAGGAGSGAPRHQSEYMPLVHDISQRVGENSSDYYSHSSGTAAVGDQEATSLHLSTNDTVMREVSHPLKAVSDIRSRTINDTEVEMVVVYSPGKRLVEFRDQTMGIYEFSKMAKNFGKTSTNTNIPVCFVSNILDHETDNGFLLTKTMERHFEKRVFILRWDEIKIDKFENIWDNTKGRFPALLAPQPPGRLRLSFRALDSAESEF